jgi:hypothetical protein
MTATIYGLSTPIATHNHRFCLICSKEYDGQGNNAYPLNGRYCDAPNTWVVVPARLRRIGVDRTLNTAAAAKRTTTTTIIRVHGVGRKWPAPPLFTSALKVKP